MSALRAAPFRMWCDAGQGSRLLVGVVVRSRDEVVYGDLQGIGQLSQGADRAAVAICLDLHDLHPVDTAGASELGLGETAELSPYP